MQAATRTPAIIDFGLSELQHNWSRVWAELAAGGVVRAVNRRTGLQAAWITPGCPPGADCLPLSVNDAVHSLGKVLARAQAGGCTEVRDMRGRGGGGRLARCPEGWRSVHVHSVIPAEVEPVADLLPGIIARTRSGRLVEREVVYA